MTNKSLLQLSLYHMYVKTDYIPIDEAKFVLVKVLTAVVDRLKWNHTVVEYVFVPPAEGDPDRYTAFRLRFADNGKLARFQTLFKQELHSLENVRHKCQTIKPFKGSDLNIRALPYEECCTLLELILKLQDQIK